MLRFSSRISNSVANPAADLVLSSSAGHKNLHDRIWPRALMPLFAGLLFFGHPVQPHAETLGAHEFIIPASDGYGTSECLREQSACGRVIADAWCEAHGHAHAIGYMKSEDITASIRGSAAAIEIPRDSVIVSCGE